MCGKASSYLRLERCCYLDLQQKAFDFRIAKEILPALLDEDSLHTIFGQHVRTLYSQYDMRLQKCYFPFRSSLTPQTFS